jgi:hypothetical protein
MMDRSVTASLVCLLAMASASGGGEPSLTAASWNALEDGQEVCGSGDYEDTCMKPLLQRETDAPVQDGLYVFDQASVKMFGMTPNEQAVARRLPREDFAMSSLLGPAGLPTTGCLWLIKADPKKIACGRFAFCACSKHRDCRRWMLPPRYSRFFPSQLKDGNAYGYPLAAAAEAARLAPVVAIVEPDERERQLGATEGGRDGAVAELTYADARAELEERCGGDYRKARKAVLKALCKGYGKDPTTGMRMKYSGTASDMWQRLELADAAAGDAPEECASFDVGDAVEVDYGGDLGWVSGKVVTIKDDGTYDVEHSQWDEGSKLQEDVEPGDMRSV